MISSVPKRLRAQKSVKKLIAFGFWDTKGILSAIYFQTGKIINSVYYCKHLDQLLENSDKTTWFAEEKIIFATMTKISES